MQKRKMILRLLTFVAILSLFGWSACKKKDDPVPENAPETITKIQLTFTNTANTSSSQPITIVAEDPDGPGTGDFTQSGTAALVKGQSYNLAIKFYNGNEDTTTEIEEEKDEHMIFFSWGVGLFSSPTGDGNIDNRADEVNYQDFDSQKYPVGLATGWTTAATATTNPLSFRVQLMHQPGIKSATSNTDIGGSDANFTFKISLQ